MAQTLKEKLELACWVARTLFDRRMGPGTTGNLSFLHEGALYITASGTSFGRLMPDDFARVDGTTGENDGRRPSKELPLHRIVYAHRPDAQAVIHVHSTHAVLWSCVPHANEADCVPAYTPYLRMTLGTVGLIDFAKPGSPELFAAFERGVDRSDGWILKNHGSVVGGTDLMKAFAAVEELEESCRIAWELRNEKTAKLLS